MPFFLLLCFPQPNQKSETITRRQWIDNEGVVLAEFKPGASVEERSRSNTQPGLKRIREYATFGGELIPLSKEDMAEIRYQANGRRTKTGLTILGFSLRLLSLRG